MMSPTVIDIETIPNSEKVEIVKAEPVSDRAKKDPVDGMALSPFTGRICCISSVQDGEPKSAFLKEINDDGEKTLVRLALGIIAEALPIVTFNGLSFDIPYIYWRAMCLGVEAPNLPLSVLTKKYVANKHFDVRMVLTGWDSYAKGTLSYFSKVILGEDRPDCDYKTFVSLITSGKGAEIAAHCESHAMLTWKLYQKIAPYYVNEKQTHGMNEY